MRVAVVPARPPVALASAICSRYACAAALARPCSTSSPASARANSGANSVPPRCASPGPRGYFGALVRTPRRIRGFFLALLGRRQLLMRGHPLRGAERGDVGKRDDGRGDPAWPLLPIAARRPESVSAKAEFSLCPGAGMPSALRASRSPDRSRHWRRSCRAPLSIITRASS